MGYKAETLQQIYQGTSMEETNVTEPLQGSSSVVESLPEAKTCRFAALEMRLTDLRSNFNLTLTIFVTLIAGSIASLALFGYLFRSDYRDFSHSVEASIDKRFNDVEKSIDSRFKVIEDKVGIRVGIPDLLVNTKEGLSLEGSTVPVKLTRDSNGFPHIGYSFSFKNIGNALAENIIFKFYFSEPLTNEFPDLNFSTDEPDFDYSVAYSRSDELPIIPPGFSLPFYTGFRLTEEAAKAVNVNSTHSVLLKVYYNGQARSHSFKIRIVENALSN